MKKQKKTQIVEAASMICPTCKTPLTPSGDYSIMDCCQPWPVVAEIPVFSGRAELVPLIREGRHREALLLALSPRFSSRLPGKLGGLDARRKRWVWNRRVSHLIDIDAPFIEWLDLYFGPDRKGAWDYFYYKFSTPRHLVALSIATILPHGPVLDIGCGFGHITRFLTHQHPVMAVDNLFYLLYVAKRIIAPDAFYVCCDVDQPLPFEDGAFGSGISTNAFHFLRNQEGCWAEMKRVSTGPIALVSLRHTGIKNNVPNNALSIDGYHALIDLPHCIVSDDAILASYLKKQGPDLSVNSPKLELAPLISIVAGGSFHAHWPFSAWPHIEGKGMPGINPLYVPSGDRYELKWPNENYRAKNPGFDYLRDVVTDDLAGNFVLIDRPVNYGSDKIISF